MRNWRREVSASNASRSTFPAGTFAALRDPWDNLFVLTDGGDF